MSFFNKIKAGLRTAMTFTQSCPGWRRDLAMIQCRESDLPRAAKNGWLPDGTLDYAMEILELKIQGKTVAKTRWQWAQFMSPESSSPFPRFPYRSYDSDRTKGVIVHRALLDLVSLNRNRPELSLDELYSIIADKYWN